MAVDVVQMQGKPSRFRPWLILLVGLSLVVVLLWTIFWHVAAQQSAASLDAWIAHEKAFNRSWSCPDRKITGFPFAIEIACSKPHFEGAIFGRDYSGTLNGFLATAKFTQPTIVTVKVLPPFSVSSDDRTVDFSLAWDKLDVLLGGLPQDVSQVSIAGQRLSLQGQAQGLGPLKGQAQDASAQISRDADRPDHALAFRIAVNGASLPVLDALLGAASPADITAEGDVTQAGFDPGRTLTQTLDQWRTAGGHVDLAGFHVTRGDTTFQARGTLAVDPAHRPEGRLETECLGYESVLRRFGIDPALINAGALLTSLFSGGGGAAMAAGPQPLHLPVEFEDGRLSIGPVRTSIRLPQLY